MLMNGDWLTVSIKVQWKLRAFNSLMTLGTGGREVELRVEFEMIRIAGLYVDMKAEAKWYTEWGLNATVFCLTSAFQKKKEKPW